MKKLFDDSDFEILLLHSSLELQNYYQSMKTQVKTTLHKDIILKIYCLVCVDILGVYSFMLKFIVWYVTHELCIVVLIVFD